MLYKRAGCLAGVTACCVSARACVKARHQLAPGPAAEQTGQRVAVIHIHTNALMLEHIHYHEWRTAAGAAPAAAAAAMTRRRYGTQRTLCEIHTDTAQPREVCLSNGARIYLILRSFVCKCNC